MGKRHPNFPAWQWRVHPENQRNPSDQVLHLMAVPLFILAFLLIVSGVFGMNILNVAIGVVGLFAALVLQRRSHSPKA